MQGDEIKNDWLHITTGDNKSGWCHRAYLELIEITPPPQAQTLYRVNTGTLNVRHGPGLNYAVIGWLNRGEAVEGLAISPEAQWAQIRKANAISGWVSLKYLVKVPAPPPVNSADVLMIVTTDTLNIRSGPGTTYAIEGKLMRGDMVTYLSATPDWKWMRIKTNQSNVGWCSSKVSARTPGGGCRP